MSATCTRCKRPTSTIEVDERGGAPIGSGVCDVCDVCARYLEGQEISLVKLLERFRAPIAVINHRAMVLGANGAGLALLGKAMGRVEGLLTAMVIECVDAHEPAECSSGVYCSGCAIRHAITETLASGRPSAPVRARTFSRAAGSARQAKDWLVTTERLGQLVLVCIASPE